MKVYFPFLLLLQITITVNGYSQSNTLNKDKKPLAKSKLYYFSGTTDSLFCNEDSIVPSDCLGGELYLSKQGNAIYIFHCCCEGQGYSSGATFSRLSRWGVLVVLASHA